MFVKKREEGGEEREGEGERERERFRFTLFYSCSGIILFLVFPFPIPSSIPAKLTLLETPMSPALPYYTTSTAVSLLTKSALRCAAASWS